jgi:hypothetical protein
VSPVRYELSFYITEEGIPHSHRRDDLKLFTLCYPIMYCAFRTHGAVAV